MSVIIKPVITEKFAKFNENSRYTFIVDKSANKIQIRNAIEKQYGVNIESVNTYITAGKSKTKMTKTRALTGRVSPVKRAIVTLVKGEVIDIYSNI
ncbi:MAG TPA: 50S ribosomal protein L23 [Cytophagales bacterium]|jgi:large subunit ribosomal protein L23|nr:50S ribosomal protein L23 [Cytophagales bacterium]